ncbi:60S ribosomal protein L5-1-like [Triticum dicoccoides]|uniref:60S ribosomal protein L5-1-like n=1 Tax=Triticum dicoccoides TaxID=85692 RepID=UPI00188E1CD7|nr:60S ribosomal protein L5-1-like [Triticum dicoccoides]
MGTPCISCAPQPSPSGHSRNKDVEAVQLRGRVGRSGGEGFTYLFYTTSLPFQDCHGALDGGLDIPHSDKRFVGFKKDEKQLDTGIHCNYIYEDHVADYMKSIADAEPEKYQFHFGEYIKKGIAADDMEALHKKVHATIPADPTMAKLSKEPPKTHKR